ncbi:hypothetical protein MMC24_001216 [Lignoscripta atroalba]|nr:hypothetical protein [Lignoscripta atroalba]
MRSFLLFILLFLSGLSIYSPLVVDAVSSNRLEKRKTVQCFKQPPPPRNVLKRIDASDCYRASHLIVIGDKAHAPMQFSRTTSFVVPHRWALGGCIIAVDMVDPDGDAILSLTEIAAHSIPLIQQCILNMPDDLKLGGRTAIGPNNEMHLFIIGRTAPAREWPLGYSSSATQTG